MTVPENANLTLTTDTGNINFNGTLDATGTYKFQTTNGDITLIVPSSSAFKLNASTNSGTISSDFPNVNIQDNPSGSGQSVNTVVGGSSHSQILNVMITSFNGNINLNQR